MKNLLKGLFCIVCLAVPLAVVGEGSGYTWYDGGTARRVWLQPDLIAEFNGQGDAVRQLDGGARTVFSAGAVRVWKVSKAGLTRTLAKGVIPAGLQGAYSPVFSESRLGGRKRALPGNVIVNLNASWSDTRVRSWAKGRGLMVLKRLALIGNYYVIQSPVGLESLRIANRLRTVEGVISASPNWWTEVHTR